VGLEETAICTLFLIVEAAEWSVGAGQVSVEYRQVAVDVQWLRVKGSHRFLNWQDAPSDP